MTIGPLTFPDRPLFLAPMEDVTDPAFRGMCRRFGADMVYTEFVSADALIRSVRATAQKLTIHDDERPVAIQIYGRDVATMVEAARIVEAARPDIIDLNFGCPVKKVAGKGAGAGMLQNTPLMLEITRAVVQAVSLPVTVKTRLGWDSQSRIIVDLAERLQDSGIAALTIHGRTRAEMYNGSADWNMIARVKQNPRMHIPIIGNGDVTTPFRARECFDLYGVDAVMVGRATFGHPWIFAEMRDFIDRRDTPSWPYADRAWQVSLLRQHVERSIEWCGGDERRGIVHSRRHIAASPTFKGLPDFRQTRIAMLRAETRAELYEIMDRALNWPV